MKRHNAAQVITRALVASLFGIAVLTTHAAEIKVFASSAAQAALRELVPAFEGASGNKVTPEYLVIAAIARRIAAGDAFDVVIASPELLAQLVNEGKVAADTRGSFGRTGIALGVPKGAPKPDISTPENLKRVLLSAKGVGHSREGQSAVAFKAALQRLGIANEMAPKLKAFDDAKEEAAALRHGDIDLLATGAGRIIEHAEAQFVGLLPSEVQSYVALDAGVSAVSTESKVARALLRFLMAPDVLPTLKANGLERG